MSGELLVFVFVFVFVSVFVFVYVVCSPDLVQPALSGELIKIKAGELKPPAPELDRNGKGGNRNAAHLKFKTRKYTPEIRIMKL